MAKRILTQNDLDSNPELVEQCLKVGDTVDIPDTEESNNTSEDGGTTDDSDDDDTGGSAPPPNKERP
jgi:hypothetical protein